MTNDVQHTLTRDQIAAMCRRGFGSAAHIESVQELTGGTFNETYLLELVGEGNVILRVAPLPAADIYWDEVALMRREWHMLPFFASIAPLMPKVLLADFTHQLIAQDYMFQTFLDGEWWEDIEDELIPDENAALWRQFGAITKQIHATTGERIGYPYPARSFDRWSDVILDRFARIVEQMQVHQLDLPGFAAIAALARTNIAFLDEIKTPALLHGDLWIFNLLVRRGAGEPTITDVLDADRAWWGDPLADWTMFCLSIRSKEPNWQQPCAAFFAGYGELGQDRATLFRQEVYKAMHIGASVVWFVRQGDRESIARARQDIGEVARVLSTLQ
jgi:aminoglycoside phosphotransferase (APT) family kinase protein